MKRRSGFKILLESVAGLINLAGQGPSERVKTILSTSDEDALRSDWEAIGNDLKNAIQKFEISGRSKQKHSEANVTVVRTHVGQ